MNQVIHEIAGNKYVAFEYNDIPFKFIKDMTDQVKLFNGIVHKLEIKNSFWNGRSFSLIALIPEEYAVEFNNHQTP